MHTSLTQCQIGEIYGIHGVTVARFFKKLFPISQIKERAARIQSSTYYGERHPLFGKKKEQCHNYKGKDILEKEYLACRKPDWFTGRRNSKYIPVHHFVYCTNSFLTEIPRGHCIHHIDEDKFNNSFSNLKLLTISEHMQLHKGR